MRKLLSSVRDYILGAKFSHQSFLGFHNDKLLHQSYWWLFQLHELQHHNMECIIYLSLSIYVYMVNLDADGTQAQPEEHLVTHTAWTKRFKWSLWSCKLRDGLRSHARWTIETELHSEIERYSSSIWRWWLTEINHALGSCDQGSLVMHVEFMIIHNWRP